MRQQYYEKFRYRYDTIQIFKRLFQMPSFKANLLKLKGKEFLDKFVNAILSDCSYCLEGGLEALKKVKKHEIA